MSRELKYEQVRELLRQRFRTQYAVGDKVPPTLQLHKDLDVSPQTINRAISDLVEEGLVVRKARRGTFVSRPKNITRNICLVCPRPLENPITRESTWSPNHMPYMARAIQGAETAASECGRHVMVSMDVDPIKPRFAESGGQVAGAIIVFNRDSETIAAYNAYGIPVVLIDPFVRTSGVPYISGDNYGGIRDSVLHLVALGHKRIAFITVDFPMTCMTLEEQLLGYCSAMREVGLHECIHVHRVPFGIEQVAADAEFVHMLDTFKPTACCCCTDGAAAGVARICHDRRIRIPDELSVTGFDRTGIAEHSSPPLTTVRVPIEEFGRKAVRILDSLIEKEQMTGESVILPMELVKRASTCAPRA